MEKRVTESIDNQQHGKYLANKSGYFFMIRVSFDALFL
jgi:hypothetical protein